MPLLLFVDKHSLKKTLIKSTELGGINLIEGRSIQYEAAILLQKILELHERRQCSSKITIHNRNTRNNVNLGLLGTGLMTPSTRFVNYIMKIENAFTTAFGEYFNLENIIE